MKEHAVKLNLKEIPNTIWACLLTTCLSINQFPEKTSSLGKVTWFLAETLWQKHSH
jgi:malate synthase